MSLSLRTTAALLLAGLALQAAPAAQAAPPGDAARGRALLLQRQESGCILCHVLPGLPPGGALGPPLHGLASRYNSSELFQRIADARRINPETIMPPYLSTEGLHNVARAQVGKSVLSEQALADIVAYLLAPQGAGDGPR
jgi:L-cysteine S-thiosulfotransferase